MMLQDQSPKCLLQLRDRFYRLLANCIPASIILKTLTKKLLVSLPSSMKQEVISSAAEYEHRMNMGSKEIFHLEAFAAKLLNLYNQFQLRSL